MKLFQKIKKYFSSKKATFFEYGKIRNGVKARRNKINGRVDILLWKKGEQGHKKDFYHQCGIGWEETFEIEVLETPFEDLKAAFDHFNSIDLDVYYISIDKDKLNSLLKVTGCASKHHFISEYIKRYPDTPKFKILITEN